MLEKNAIMLGIDPGYDRVGIAIINKINNKENLIFSTCIKTNRKDIHTQRLKQIAIELSEIIIKYTPSHACIEELFVFKNQKTVMQVAEARGVMSYICEINNIKISELTPMQIKSSVAGHGHADKTQVEYMVKNILGINKKNIAISKDFDKKIDDEIDAMAIAISGLTFLKSSYY
jgi:crossover junction endodeoxyribonuclease RuvC